MDATQHRALPRGLALGGGIVGLLFALFTTYFSTLLFAFGWSAHREDASVPLAGVLFFGLLAFLGVVSIVGSVLLLVVARKLGRSRRAAQVAVVAGVLAGANGNFVAAGLGVAAGALALSS